MYGYPGVVIQVEDVVKEQSELLMEYVNESEKLIKEQQENLKKLEELLKGGS